MEVYTNEQQVNNPLIIVFRVQRYKDGITMALYT